MAFLISSTEVVTGPPITYVFSGTASEAFSYGQALKLAGGLLTKAAGTDQPTFICLKDVPAESTSVPNIPVLKITPILEFETTSTVAVPASNIGAKVTLSTDGTQVTNTTTGGTFMVLQTSNTAGGAVRGKFNY